MSMFRRVWHLLNRSRFERELVEEMEHHRAVMSDSQRFGDTHRLLEQSRDVWGWNWLDDALQDMKLGVRALMRAPAFTITAVMILTFGIGLNVTLFHMASVGIIRPPAVKSPETLARFYRQEPRGGNSSLPYPLTQFIKQHNTALSAVLVEAGSTVAFGEAAAESIDLSLVSTNWFEELGYGALHGRVFSEHIDAQPDAPPAVIVAYHFWQSRFGGDPAVVGTSIYVEKRPFTIVGIAPRELPGLDFDVPAVFVPIQQREYLYPGSSLLQDWGVDFVALYGRLRPGMTRAAARESLRSTMQAASAERREIKSDEWLEPHLGSVNFMDDDDRAGAWAVLSLLAALTTLVLLVVAANLGNLLLSKATGRVRELGVRVALGARRSRIVRQLIIEAVPLALLGAAGSVLMSWWVADTIARVTDLPAYLDFSPDARVLAASVFLAALSLLAIGLLPAWKVAQQDLTNAIKDGGQNVSRVLDRAMMRRLMIAAQVAGSCLLLVVAAMMVRAIQRVVGQDVGFEYRPVAVLSMPLSRFGIAGDAVVPYWHAVKARAVANPEVAGAAIVTAAPLGGRVYEITFKDAPGLQTLQQSIDPDYFGVMRIPLRSGRTFTGADQGVVIVSERLALAMYGTTDVLGRGFPLSTPKDIIVGVAADAHTIKINATDVAEIYRPLKREDFNLVFLVARSRSDAARLIPILREAAEQDPRVIASVRLMRDDFARRVRGSWVAGAVAGGIGFLTLLLTCLGIFGVVSYGVALRIKEIGIRMALGAERRALLLVILRQVMSPVAAGMIVGLAAAAPAAMALSGQPFYLRPGDPVAFVAALAIFSGAGLAAALWPAVRALRGNPIEALRHQ